LCQMADGSCGFLQDGDFKVPLSLWERPNLRSAARGRGEAGGKSAVRRLISQELALTLTPLPEGEGTHYCTANAAGRSSAGAVGRGPEPRSESAAAAGSGIGAATLPLPPAGEPPGPSARDATCPTFSRPSCSRCSDPPLAQLVVVRNHHDRHPALAVELLDQLER